MTGKILVVDDDNDVRNMLDSFLNRNDNRKIARLGRPKFTHPCLDFSLFDS